MRPCEFRAAVLILRRCFVVHYLCFTLLNAIYCKPRTTDCTYFSYASVLTSNALRSIALEPDSLTAPPAGPPTVGKPEGTDEGAADQADKDKVKERGPCRRSLVRVSLGTWDIDEVQICEMSNHGPEGKYVCGEKNALD